MRETYINQYYQSLQRVCQECRQKYTIGQYLQDMSHYFPRPWNYRSRCETYCLECWLGVGLQDFPAEGDDDPVVPNGTPAELDECLALEDIQVRLDHDNWPYDDIYQFLVQGNLLPSFQWFLDKGANLAVMPIARMHVDKVVVFPNATTFYPAGVADIKSLNLVPNSYDPTSPADICSAASGITHNILENYPLVVFPCWFDWEIFRRSNHGSHLDFIRYISEEIDRCCLNFVRYRFCRLGQIEDLPAHAGQIASNPMMAGVLFYSSAKQEARIIGGAAFTHYITYGLGLSLQQLEWEEFPRDGEVGQIVNHALSLYASLLETDTATTRFMQALCLLDFLADPNEYRSFKELKKIIACYSANDSVQYYRILDRLKELTSKKDSVTGLDSGYRHNVVHMGKRLESLVPNNRDRTQLFLELDDYIRPMVNHMIAHSQMSWADFVNVRNTHRSFETLTATQPSRCA